MTTQNRNRIASWWNKQDDPIRERLLILDPHGHLPEDLALSMQADGVSVSQTWVGEGPRSWTQPGELVEFLEEKRREQRSESIT